MLLSAKCGQPTISPHYWLHQGAQMCPTNHPSTQPTMGCHCVPCGSVHSDQTRKAQTISPNCFSNSLTHFLAVCFVLPVVECSFLMFACQEKQTCRKPWWGGVWEHTLPVSGIAQAETASQDAQDETHLLHWDQPVLTTHQIPLWRERGLSVNIQSS